MPNYILWENKVYIQGPHRKDWRPRDTPPPPCPVQWHAPRSHCLECYPTCGVHQAGCVFTTDFTPRGPVLPEEDWGKPAPPDLLAPQSDYDYWLISPACSQYHG